MHQKTLNIIGRGRGSRLGLQADGVKWCVNVPCIGADLMFDMHQDHIPRVAARQAIASERGIPVMSLSNYPLQEVIQHFKTKFFSNSICYMLALGIYQKFEVISLWGCNIKPQENEPIVKNHPGVEFWIGQAMGRGIEVQVQGESTLLELPGGKLYGYDVPPTEMREKHNQSQAGDNETSILGAGI